jgi:hypothetical protein
MEAKKFTRRRLWVYPAFQSRILLRQGLYALLLLVVVWHVTFIFDLMSRIASSNSPNLEFFDLYVDFASRQRPLLISFVLVMPIVLHDMLKFSHRVAGPLFRARKAITDMIDGKQVPEFKSREKDLMGEFFDAFNALTRIWNARLQLDAVHKQHADLAPKEPGGSNVMADAPTMRTRV